MDLYRHCRRCLTTGPDDLGLDFAIAATFIALVVPEIKTLATLVAVITAGIFSLIFSLMEFELGLVCSAVLAMIAGYAIQLRGEQLRHKQEHIQ